ncbi:MAG: TonB-dependent receptor [Ekhidna sp.]
MRTLFLSATMLISGLAYAQDSLKTLQLEEVAITAVRASEQAPIPQTNISKKQIEEVYVGQHPIFMLEKLTPGFFSYSESGSSFANYGSFRLRGINQERINITLNGVPLNDMIDQGVFFSNFTDVANNFESIQVQRGVGTSSNGVSSYGGSINFESINLRGKESFSEAQLGVGSFDTYRGNFQHFTGINEKGWGFLTSFSKLTTDGYRDNTETDATSFFLTGGYYGDRDIFKMTLFSARSENGLGYYTIDKSILDQNPRFNNLTTNDKDDFRQHMIQLQYNRFINENWTVGATAYYGGAGGDYIEGTPDVDSVFVENYFAQYQTTFFAINYPLSNDHFGGILNADYSQGKLNLNTGLHAYTFRRENREEVLPDIANPYYLEQSQKDEISWYGKATYNFGKLVAYADVQVRTAKLTISPDYNWIGIASEGDITNDWTFINPKIGVTYDMTNALSLYSSFGRSGREPAKIDLLGGFQLNASNYPLVRAGNNFKEEYVNDLEIGARLNKSNLVIDGNFYYMSFEDEIAPIGDVIAFGLQARENIAKSTRAGFELLWVYSPSKLIELNGNLAYLKSNIENANVAGTEISDKEQILSPDWIVNTQIKVNPTEKLSLGLSGRYLGEQFMELSNNPTFTVPSSFIADFVIEAQVSPSIKVTGYVNNLLDKTYYTYGVPGDVDFSGTTEPGFLAQPDRNFFLNLNIKF